MSTFIEYTKTKQFRWISSALLLVALLILPFLFKNYRVFQFNLVLVYAVAVLGLNMLTGFNGQISLGHGAFFAVGAYVAAVLMDRAAMPYWATLPFSAVVCFVVGWLMGFPALRLGGHYLALATYAFALAVPQLLKYKNIEGWTGGVQGIVLTKPEPPISFSFLGQPFSADRWLYVFTLAVAALMFLVAWNLLRGRVGRGAAASACVLLYSTGDSPRLGETARARLKAMAQTQDGFEIARRDLEIRGPGEFLGARQSGAPLLRFADLATDVELLAWARESAPLMLDRHNALAQRHILRWLGGKADYLKA